MGRRLGILPWHDLGQGGLSRLMCVRVLGRSQRDSRFRERLCIVVISWFAHRSFRPFLSPTTHVRPALPAELRLSISPVTSADQREIACPVAPPTMDLASRLRFHTRREMGTVEVTVSWGVTGGVVLRRRPRLQLEAQRPFGSPQQGKG